MEDEGAERGSRFMSSMVNAVRFLLFFITLEVFLGICIVFQLFISTLILFLFYMCSYLTYLKISFSMTQVLLVQKLNPISSAQEHTERSAAAPRLHLGASKTSDIWPRSFGGVSHRFSAATAMPVVCSV